jgi:aminopeptidase-like protein
MPYDQTPQIDLFALASQLYPFTRSLTGDGVRQTLRTVAQHIPLTIHEVPSGTQVLDWEVPNEWNIRSATIKTMDGRTIVDFADSNLHVVSYSLPVHGVMSRDDLAKHIHTLPEQPDLIPYRTGYFANNWGFCLRHDQWTQMTDAEYQVDIDSDLKPGHLSYGEFVIPGESDDEVLITVHCCHPSLANDNLAGISVATALAMRQSQKKRHLSYRFLFMPATIGAITWLAQNEAHVGKVKHGLVLTCVGDPGPFHYKKSRSPARVDLAVEHALSQAGHPFETLPFNPYGYDERQFCSPAFDMPVGCFMRGVHGTFPEYHTSADNLTFIKPEALNESYILLSNILDILDQDRTYVRVDGRGEPQLGRRGMYRAIAGQKEAGGANQMDILWLLNLADGKHSLLDMAIRSGTPFARLVQAAGLCLETELIRDITHTFKLDTH